MSADQHRPSGHPHETPITDEARAMMRALPREERTMSAAIVLTRLQKVMLVLIGLALAAGFLADWTVTLIAMNGICLTFYLVVVGFKAYLIHLAITSERELEFSTDQIQDLDEDELPVYTLLLPLYEEADVLPGLVEGLRELDYPEDKLDVLMLLEEDDYDTIRAARALDLPPWIRVVRVPADEPPRTKPKACNIGLGLARGDYLVIYDAEDRPEPDQLKKAILGFRHVPDDVICLQAKLNFYNQRQNLLTRWFTTDYSVWFDLMLPGVDYLQAPIPLGGTSNHFRVDVLKELRGWDPFNVTEDCDLGVRLAMRGYRTCILDSTTWEEACSDLSFWVKQRSRWTKGYIQTYLVHLRRPLSHLLTLGPGKTLSFHLMVGGTFLCLLINPVYWLLTAGWFIFRWEEVSVLFPFPLILWGLLCLFAGNFVFIYSSLLATYQRGYYDLVKHCLFLPFYWVLASVGAWKGFAQLITNPSYWEKTKHGLDQEGE
ncbi:MAG: glycosyltransferase family 2 protein [Planctomycetota bacterium]